MTQKSTRKFHIESDNPADFLKQVGEQLQEMPKNEAKFQIEADTAVEFLKQVGNVVSKISFGSLAKEPMEIEDYFAEAESLAKKLFYSAVVVDWNYSDYNVGLTPDCMADVVRLKFAEDLRYMNFGAINSFEGFCPFTDDELPRIFQWSKDIHSYSDVEKIYHQELGSMTESEREILFNMVYYIFGWRDKGFVERLAAIDREAGKPDFFRFMLRTSEFKSYPDLMLQLLVEGKFRDLQSVLNHPGHMIYIPSLKQGIVFGEEIEDIPRYWFDADSIDDAIAKIQLPEMPPRSN